MKSKREANQLEQAWTRLLLRYNAAIEQYQESDRHGKPDANAMERIRDTLIELARVAERNRQVILDKWPPV
jgi:hypothetical protein